jgi:hypothetical protein
MKTLSTIREHQPEYSRRSSYAQEEDYYNPYQKRARGPSGTELIMKGLQDSIKNKLS